MSLFAKIHIPNANNDYIPIKDINFEENVAYLKKQIAKIANCDAKRFELIYHGMPLNDEQKLSELITPNSIVHCFEKNPATKPYVPAENLDYQKALDLFTQTSNVQISMSSRFNILQKILAEYPEFRQNLAAQALIRDSVLFSSLHQPEVMRNIATHYPIIIEAAPFIVDTMRKELLRSTSIKTNTELTTDSTTSSEEENYSGGSSRGARRYGFYVPRSSAPGHRVISRHHLQAALAVANVGNVGSANSLANIAQRDTAAAVAANPLPTSASGERLSEEMFRHQLQRALSAMGTQFNTSNNGNTTAGQSTDTSQAMETDAETTITTTTTVSSNTNTGEDEDGDIPTQYRGHQYAQQLRTMIQMGFLDCEENINFLNISNGNIEIAINLLMGSMN